MHMGYSISQINDAARMLYPYCKEYKVIAFHGEMGSGKTTLISALCSLLGCRSQVSSPTFSIIQEYSTDSGEPIYHIDLYRIAGEQEAMAAGVEETLFSGHLCFVEWPEIAPGIFPENTVHVYLKVINETTRDLSISTFAEKSY